MYARLGNNSRVGASQSRQPPCPGLLLKGFNLSYHNKETYYLLQIPIMVVLFTTDPCAYNGN